MTKKIMVTANARNVYTEPCFMADLELNTSSACKVRAGAADLLRGNMLRVTGAPEIVDKNLAPEPLEALQGARIRAAVLIIDEDGMRFAALATAQILEEGGR